MRADVYDMGPPPGDRGSYLLPPLCQPSRDLGDPNVVVELPGAPRGWGRVQSRFIPKNTETGKGGFVSHYTQKETRSYEAMLRYAGEQAMAGRPLYLGPMRIHLYTVFAIPASWSHRKRAAAEEGYIRPTGKPDWDNLGKMCDGLNGVIWRDDAQIVDGHVLKIYGDKPTYRMEIWEITGAML
jgi:Holliday junction resolvase RusA-like endonuclease